MKINSNQLIKMSQVYPNTYIAAYALSANFKQVGIMPPKNKKIDTAPSMQFLSSRN